MTEQNNNYKAEYLAKRQRLMDANAYNPADEHDACGVGLVVQMDGSPNRKIVEAGIKALKNVWHRGAVDADGKNRRWSRYPLGCAASFFPWSNREDWSRTK